MRMQAGFWVIAACSITALAGAAPQPAAWVPARWPWPDPKSLELLAGSPINCLLVSRPNREFTSAAAERGLVTLAVVMPGGDAASAVRQALSAGISGLVLEGDFTPADEAAAKRAAGAAPVIELTARRDMKLGSDAPVIGTYQGVWPGIAADRDGAMRAGPTGSAWIDTNTGFIRAVRAWGGPALWIANRPPPKTVVTGARYLQAIADAAISGARWVVALDADFAARLGRRDPAAMRDWARMNELLGWFERHPEWRAMRESGKLAVVQDPAKGGLLSGGILDMIAVKHTPVRPVPVQHLTAEALNGATMAVNVDAGALTPEQRQVLQDFTRSGGTLLTAPSGWQDERPEGEQITLDKAELNRLNDIWRDVNSMVGRQNLGVRLFNVASMLSNALISADGATEIVHLVNYSDYPVEDVTMQFLGDYRRATLLTPDGAEKPLEIYKSDEGPAVDIPKVGVCAAVRLER
jgi:hypothetical protein